MGEMEIKGASKRAEDAADTGRTSPVLAIVCGCGSRKGQKFDRRELKREWQLTGGKSRFSYLKAEGRAPRERESRGQGRSTSELPEAGKETVVRAVNM